MTTHQRAYPHRVKSTIIRRTQLRRPLIAYNPFPSDIVAFSNYSNNTWWEQWQPKIYPTQRASKTHSGDAKGVNPVPRTYVRGFGALPFGASHNIHPRTHVRGVLWYGVNSAIRY